jgi:hypothetical protein
MPNLTTVIQRAFDAPSTSLGTVERNTEIKVVFLMLWELGWDPVNKIATCFQIRRDSFKPPAKAALAADPALRDDFGLCAIGEVKQWYDSDWPKAEEQLRRYQSSLMLPRAFLTCGWKWTVLTESESHHFENRNDAALLLDNLRALLGAGLINKTAREQDLWRYGLCPNPKRMRIADAQV